MPIKKIKASAAKVVASSKSQAAQSKAARSKAAQQSKAITPAPTVSNRSKRSSGEAINTAYALIAKIPIDSNFEEYAALPVAEATENRNRKLEIFGSADFAAKIKNNEYLSDNDRVQPVHFDAGWIPFAQDGGGCLLCLDINPGPKGKLLQLIQWEMRGGGAFVRAPSLSAFRKSS
jgi:hypothetical protein